MASNKRGKKLFKPLELQTVKSPNKVVSPSLDCSPSLKSDNSSQTKTANDDQLPSTPLRTSPPDELIAYVHELSPLKRNRKNTMNYCTLTLQTSSEPPQDALLYSPNKRPLLMDSEESHTPLKIKCFTYTPDKKLIINDMTNLTLPDQTEYSFQFKATQSPKPPTQIQDIFNSSTEFDKIILCGKVLNLGETRTVGSRNLNLATATFADLTGTINVDIWERHIPMIERGKVYSIDPAMVRIWAGIKKMTTLERSLIKLLADETLANIDIPEQDIESKSDSITITVPKIYTVENVGRFLHCLNCGRRILQATAGLKVVHCDRCRYTMRIDDCTKKVSGKLIVQSEGQQLHLTAFEDALRTSIGNNINALSESTISEKLLLLDNITVKYSPTTYIISELSF
ncbi:hypothetical protein QZH41_007955 [Actinostola sp. cb2023]|nr:hypothetical protein QZH41_005379 [Actinostola sp. cb2023]KAK3754168.1 hypothetical protein QZH41_007955 [Actinostola sp. cb2023]